MLARTALVLICLTLVAAAQPPEQITRSFDMRDLLQPVPDMRPRTGGLQSKASTQTPATGQIQPPTAAELQARLLSSISVGLGQTNATFEIKENELVATGSKEELLALERVLAGLKQQRDVQINVEVRVLYLADQDVQALPDELRTQIAEAAFAPQPLSDESNARLLEPLRQATGSSALTAPNLTLFNQQQAFVQVATNKAYISDFKRDEQGELKPVPDSVWSGIHVNVRAAASPDGTQASAAVALVIQSLIGFDEVKLEGTDLVKQVPKVQRFEVDRQMTGLQTVLLDARRLDAVEGADGAQAQPQMVLYLVRLTPIVRKEIPRPGSQPPTGR